MWDGTMIAELVAQSRGGPTRLAGVPAGAGQ